MPVNFLHSLLHRVETGWDPIPRGYAERYSRTAWDEQRELSIGRIEALAGNLKGKRVLDLGAGPGQYSVLMAQRGARVTSHDISRQYQRIARTRAEAAGVKIEFSLGYLETARKFGPESFDLVFCRMCWYYCRSDRKFASLVYSLAKPGGIGYVECNTPAFSKPRGFLRLQHWLNAYFSWKIGHPMPPHGRMAKLIQNYPIERLELDYSSELVDVVLFVKGKSSAKRSPADFVGLL